MLNSKIKSIVALFCLLSALPLMIAIAHAEEQDKITLADFDLDKREVQSPDTIHFGAHIISPHGLLKESKSNIAVTNALYLGPRSLWHPFKAQEMTVFFSASPVFGNDTDGTFSGEMRIDEKTSEGVWHLAYVNVVDAKGISRQYEGEDLEAFKADFSVQVGAGRWLALLIGIPFICFLVIYTLYAHKRGWLNAPKNIKDIYTGKDGASSTSKAQFLLWTVVVLYAYIIVVVDGYFNQGWLDLTPQVPGNLLMAMGLASITALGAKSITSDYANRGLIFSADTSSGGLFLEDDGYPSLTKIQLAAWNLVAVGIFLAKVLNGTISSETFTTGLPDIDSTLLVLIGIGDASYLGKKLADKGDPNAPKLSDINPSTGTKDTIITITGSNFGKTAADGFIVIGDKGWKKTKEHSVIQNSDCSWKENEIKFKLACLKPAPEPFPSGETKIGLDVGGRDSANQLDFKFD